MRMIANLTSGEEQKNTGIHESLLRGNKDGLAVAGAGKASLNVALSGVQASVRDGFGDVFGLDVFSLIKVGDGA